MDQPDGQRRDRSRRPWWKENSAQPSAVCERPLQPGDACPTCLEGTLAFNGLFQLECRRCGRVAEPGAFT